MKKTLFISDLHLDEHEPAITALFLSLLGSFGSDLSSLYILGDFFEYWIGDDENTPFHRQIIQALRTVTNKGIPIYLMVGNRDFLIGKRFFAETGCIPLPDEATISLYGTPVLLMHGDTLCTGDAQYLKWRKLSRNPFIQFIFKLLPLRLRKKMAEKARATSKLHTNQTAMEIMDVTQEAVERVMQKHGVCYLIHGHTHRPGIHQFQLGHQAATRIVLGAWHDKSSILEWDNSHGQRFITNHDTANM